MGHGAEGARYRFQWNFPIFFSPHDPNKIYAASQHLHVTTNEGQSWETISPDLTTNDSTKQKSSGGPITKDNTSVEYYCTIFAAIESPYEKDLLWTGSDDGLIHISKDGGKNWENVTPPSMPKWMMINSLDADPFTKGGLYVAGTRYKLGDYTPYLYKTKDYGKTWTQITSGIPNDDFTRVVRADPDKKGMLYAGTEKSVYISYDDGNSWSTLAMNLPTVPITDLTIKNKNLIAATQGRSFWMIDDLSVFHQLKDGLDTKKSHLFKPMDAYRMDGRGNGKATATAGENHPGGVMVHYFLKDTVSKDTVRMVFKENDGDVIKVFSTHPNKKEKEEKLTVKPGSNRFVWNMKYEDAEKFDGMILWWASLSGPTAVPGKYKVSLDYNGDVQEEEFEILKDPRSSSSVADIQKQFDFIKEVSQKLTESHIAIKNIRKVSGQINDVNAKLKEQEGNGEVIELGDSMLNEMKQIEESLYQTKNRSGQDPLNYPIRLTNKLGHLNSLSGMGDYSPTDQAIAYKEEITKEIDIELKKLADIFETKIPNYNKKVEEIKVDAVIIKD